MCNVASGQVFSLDKLKSPHQALGNGQHLVCAAVALASALASIALHPPAEIPRVVPPPEILSAPTPQTQTKPCLKLPEDHYELLVSPDGRCFFSCLYLHLGATDAERAAWSKVLRSPTGFPLASERLKEEDH